MFYFRTLLKCNPGIVTHTMQVKLYHGDKWLCTPREPSCMITSAVYRCVASNLKVSKTVFEKNHSFMYGFICLQYMYYNQVPKMPYHRKSFRSWLSHNGLVNLNSHVRIYYEIWILLIRFPISVMLIEHFHIIIHPHQSRWCWIKQRRRRISVICFESMCP